MEVIIYIVLLILLLLYLYYPVIESVSKPLIKETFNDNKLGGACQKTDQSTDGLLDKLLKLPFTERLAISLCKDITNQTTDISLRYAIYKRMYSEFQKLTKSLTGIDRNKGKYFLMYFKKHANPITRDYYESHACESEDKMINKDTTEMDKYINIIMNMNEPTITLVYPILKN